MRIALTGGVTGGHIYPAIAVADKFKEKDPNAEIIYIASGHPLEREIIPKAGYELFEVESEPFYRDSLKKIPKTVSAVLKGRSQAVRILRKFKPDILFSTGSYVSIPVVLAAASLKIPVYLHEQNGFPGISNKVMARYAGKVFLGFQSASSYFDDKSKLVYSGNPVRSEFGGRNKKNDRQALGISEEDFVIMVFGGSQGSDTTNKIGGSLAARYSGEDGVVLIWGTGDKYYDSIAAARKELDKDADNIRIMPYISDMPLMLSACDVSVSRSGALSVAETAMAGRVGVFVPSPNVTEDHQYYNAKALADAGGAFIVREDMGEDAAAREVVDIVEALRNDEEMVERMSESALKKAPTDAAEIIYRGVMESYVK